MRAVLINGVGLLVWLALVLLMGKAFGLSVREQRLLAILSILAWIGIVLSTPLN